MSDLVEYKTVNYPIERVGTTFRNMDSSMTASFLWRLQQAVANAKFEVLKLIYQEDKVPVNDLEVEYEVVVQCRVKSLAVDGEATDYKKIAVPVGSYAVTSYQLDGPIGKLYSS